MSLGNGHLDWRHLFAQPSPSAVDPRLRLRLISVVFVLSASVVFLRVVELELRYGDVYRAAAATPLRRERELPGVRGRILARDGTVLASDRPLVALAVHYRYLEAPANAQWLRNQARSRLTAGERRDPKKASRAAAEVLRDREHLHRRLAELSGLTFDDWTARLGRIQRRVETISESVNRRQQERPGQSLDEAVPPAAAFPFETAIRRWLDAQPRSPSRSAPAVITVAEEFDYHPVAEGLPVDLVAEIERHPDRYRGVRIELRRRRVYPHGPLAAHTVGHLGSPGRAAPVPALEHGDAASASSSAPIGLMGVERAYEAFLRGRSGMEVELTDHGGRVVSTTRRQEPTVGRDLVLTLDVPLQRTAESLLDSALSRRLDVVDEPNAAPEGALVVLNVHSGAVLASASAPRFDPQDFSDSGNARASALLVDPAHPLFDRVCRMAVPPGSVFKTLTAVALLESGLDPDVPYYCRGYLEQPDRQRCPIFTRSGTGHAEMRLADALAQSCNVYFFHAAGEAGPGPLVDWGRRFGLGRPTGIDLPDEAAGHLSTPGLEGSDHGGTIAETQAMAIGQGTLLATPLQIARLMAAIANGGQLVTPHVASSLGLVAEDAASAARETTESLDEHLLDFPPPRRIEGLNPQVLDAVREGLERVVSDPLGTGRATVQLDAVAIAGKTGTAETGGDQGDHAWFAGYAPADAPRVAFVVVLEHAGSGSLTAGPIARRLVQRMHQLGYFQSSRHAPRDEPR